MLKVLSNILCDLDPKVKVIGQKAGICDGVPSTSALVDFLFILTPVMGVCNCSMFRCTSLYIHSSIAIILMGKRELVALLNLSPWCLVMVELLFLAVPGGGLRFVIVVFPDHTHLLFFERSLKYFTGGLKPVERL